MKLYVLSCCFFCSLLLAATAPAKPPNLLLILADDMGYGDLGVTGSQFIKTPNIDALAESGVLCSRAYVASSVCSPSRAGLLTGRDPRRFGYQSNLNGASRSYATRPELLGLSPTEHTLADHLRAAGYSTAIIGKWHLGTGPEHHPNQRGFDYFCGMLGGGHGYFPTPQRNRLERNGEPLKEFSSAYLTDFFTDEAIGWIEDSEHRDADKPWMLFLSYNAPHTPMQATDDDLAACEHIKNPKRRTYAAMMRGLDRGVGRVIKKLDERGERDNTLVVFFSDNGGATTNTSWNGELSGAKGSLLEGGIRVPMIWNWPGKLPRGVKYDQVVSSLDVLPTFLAAAEADLLPLSPPASHEDAGNRKRAVAKYGAYDGVNLLDLLGDPDVARSKPLFWRLQGQAAVLQGETKLLRLSHRPPQLFNTLVDASEQHDLIESDRDRVAQLFAELAEWESNLATVPLWGSSPRWRRQSARIYDTWESRPEPR